jgi:DNA-binding MarR family transcriptional regulator/GNAT superfamily N-acetyltransferase
MHAEQVQQVRRFNRTVTQSIGALDERYMARGRPLGEARLLWEIGPDGREVRALRNGLDLDSAHVSRLLRSLEQSGLAQVEPSAADRRIRVARLTRAGAAERRVLDRRSDELASSLIAPLDASRRERLLDAMRTVERLLTYAAVEIRQVDPTHPDARQCLRAYFAELERRSQTSFDPTTGSTAEPHEIRPPAGSLLVAYRHAEAIGCGAVKHQPGGPSDIKRMWVSPAARGLGLGRRLLADLEAIAVRAGATALRLETNRTLVEGIALYRSTGYREVPAFNDESFADHWFQKPLPAGP